MRLLGKRLHPAGPAAVWPPCTCPVLGGGRRWAILLATVTKQNSNFRKLGHLPGNLWDLSDGVVWGNEAAEAGSAFPVFETDGFELINACLISQYLLKYLGRYLPTPPPYTSV